VHEDGHVHAVQLAQPQQLGLAAQELDPTRRGLLGSPLQVDVLLGRHRHEQHTPGQ